MQNFDCPNTIYGQVGKSIKHALQQKFTTCPVLRVSRLNPIISNNSAYLGSGISNFKGGIVEVSNSTISSGAGRGIYNRGTMNVGNSTISNNSANGGYGGGIWNDGGTIQVNNSILSNNSAIEGGGIWNDGTIQVNNSTLSNNSALKGGGICNISTIGILEVSNSTLSGNKGNGIYNRGTTNVSNSTISGNTSVGNGGGIYNDGTLTLVFSTLTLNSAANGSGVYNVGTSPAKERNTIIAANLPIESGINPDVSGIFNSEGYNLIGDSTGSTGFDATGDIVGTSDNPIDPRLAPLDFYGGDTQTIALLPDSPAIDAGDPTILDTDPTTDQRGFPRVVNGRADIGAFEFSA